ncbi:RB3GP protein, partial [Nyctiprogne leucopyga]|nr:RB3GP protein [Nyctiprogne leucopyga]
NSVSLLGDFLTEFFKLCRRKESTDEILGRSAFEEEGKVLVSLALLISKFLEMFAKMRFFRLLVIIHLNLKNILMEVWIFCFFKFLFPDAADKLADGFESRGSTSAGNNPPPENEDYNLFSQFKSAPSDSLTYKLALCLCMINFYHGGVKGVAHLWQEFVLEMRYRWENNYLIPGLANGPPDLRCCLLHQKLQMLNCCIERKKARDEGKRGSMSDRSPGGTSGDAGKGGDRSGDNPDKEKEVGKSWESWSDSEEEFFECLSDTEDLKGNGQENGKKGGAKEGNKEPVNLKPEGRLHPHGKLTLLHPGEPLYIPITQVSLSGQPVPVACLLSSSPMDVFICVDVTSMKNEGTNFILSSFQAANPGCCLEDFVRWYSPRDYIEEEVVDEKGNVVIKGELSARMKIPSNMWVEAWETAKPVPARRQKRLFDDTREAEKVLHYLAVQKPADLARHLLPCIIHAAVLKVKEEEALEDISSVKKIIKQIISHSSKVLRFPNPEDKKLEEIVAQIMSVEAIIARARSLKAKFGVEKCENEEEKEDLQRFVNCLLEQPEVSVIGAGRGPAGSIIHKLFVNAQRVSAVPPLDEELRRSGSSEERRLNVGAVSDFPPPTGREVILRTTVPRPAPYSKPLPQRMYSVLTKEDFRLAGAFSADTTFF